ncbi:MAG: transglycosylase domain-containing protein [Bacteroides sp.]|nr:transglycosylase domain-containing protein [Bacteroides sp.]MCM1379682.1 transglycosylase domain-containing protein [Bacteroides sp.]MCM1446037.1 transglycosylase domain-containing protein [Prevotella sp.]
MKKEKIGISARSRRIIKALWVAFGAVVVGVALLLVLIYNGIIGYMPDIESLKNPTDKFASVVYSADGQELGRYFRPTGNRVYADYSEISENVINALIATEDARFMDHSGIDAKAIARAMVKTVFLQQKSAGGGSTLTQQLAKQLYSPGSRNIFQRAIQKPVEWMIAVKLERFYSKEEIIKMYLNQFDFLYNAVGIKSAAWVYFGKDANDLNIEEAATLVGMVKNPSYFNPIRKPERTRDRRNTVLSQMEKNGYLTESQRDSLSAMPLTLDYHKVDHKDGPAPYFREELRRMLGAKKPLRSDYPKWEGQKFVDDSIAWATNPLYGWIEKNPKPDGSHYDIYTDGLRINTTIDSRMQQYAEDALVSHLSKTLQPAFWKEKKGSKSAPYSSNREEVSAQAIENLIARAIKDSDRYRWLKKEGLTEVEIQRNFNEPTELKVFTYDGWTDTTMTPRDSILYHKSFLRAGFMAMDPRNGYVKAYVGGPNFSAFQYDMVSTGRRQVGSTIKPLLYTYAMEEGFTPCDEFLNEQPTIYDANGRPWQPRNAGTTRVGEMVDLRWALTNSNNWISARLMDQLSPATFAQNLHTFGINNHIDPVVSLCLGICDVSVKEMVTAYSAFANGGMRTDPLFVTSITDSNGNVISEFTTSHTEVISGRAYWRILSILLNVVDSGTGSRLRRAPFNLTAQMGGKTGTTNSNSDGWFMGFTPELVTATWVGGEEKPIHFNSMAQGQGASMALPITGKFLTKVFADKSLPYRQDTQFIFPEGINLCEGEDVGVLTDTTSDDPAVDNIFD